MKIKNWILVICLALSAGISKAETLSPGDKSISFLGFSTKGDTQDGAYNDMFLSFSLDYAVTGAITLGIRSDLSKTNGETFNDYSIQGRYHFAVDLPVVPFVGVGLVQLQETGFSDLSGYLIDAGILQPITENVDIEYAYLTDTYSNKDKYETFAIGLKYKF